MGSLLTNRTSIASICADETLTIKAKLRVPPGAMKTPRLVAVAGHGCEVLSIDRTRVIPVDRRAEDRQETAW